MTQNEVTELSRSYTERICDAIDDAPGIPVSDKIVRINEVKLAQLDREVRISQLFLNLRSEIDI